MQTFFFHHGPSLNFITRSNEITEFNKSEKTRAKERCPLRESKANLSGSVIGVSWTLNLLTCTNNMMRENRECHEI